MNLLWGIFGFYALRKFVLSQICYSQVNSALFKFGYGEKFIHMIEVPHTNIQSKTQKNGLLSVPFTLMRSWPGVSTLILFFITVTEVPAIFTDADARIKGVQI